MPIHIGAVRHACLPWSRAMGVAAALGVIDPAAAGTLYRCTEANGKITYSGKPCKESGNAGAERAIDFPVAPPRPTVLIPKSASVPAALSTQRRVAAMRFFYDPAGAWSLVSRVRCRT